MENIIESVKEVHELRAAGLYCESNWLDAKMCIGMREITKL